MALVLDCDTGKWPWPPENATAMSAFRGSETDLRWDDPSIISTGPAPLKAQTAKRAVVTLVISGTPTVLAPATGSLIVTSAPIAVGDTVEIDGVVLTAVNGVSSNPDEFDGSSADPEVVAANLLTAINEGSVGTWQIATATRTGATLNLTTEAINEGSKGNEITLVSTAAPIVASGATLSGGTDLATLTIGQYTLSGVDGPRTSGERDFDINDAAKSLTEAINDAANGFSYVYAENDGGECVYIHAAILGQAGNGIGVSTTSDVFTLSHTATGGGDGTPCPPGKSNANWNVLGVNVYRSDTGERGPYFRVNQIPVGTLFYRDRTDVVEVPNEVIPWEGGWVFKGDSPNNKGWRIRTRYRPLVKPLDDSGMVGGNVINADSPFDVEVYVDGERAPVRAVFGPTGEIDLSTERVWDPSTDTFIDPTIPTESSSVVVRYHYRKGELLENTLDRRYKVFYRLTTVAQDPTGTSPTGMVETPLEYCPPISPMNSEKIDYIWKEAQRRNRWILEQGGERVKLFIRRVTGNPCPCHWDARLLEYSKQPLNQCLMCYGTGWIGGYEGPYDLIVGPAEGERRVAQTPNGRRLEFTYEVWIGPSPMVSQRDFIVKQNGERYSIGPVNRTEIRGLVLQQSFQIGYLDTGDIRYRVPMGALERLPWPQTRYTSPEFSTCESDPPYPVGHEYQAAPMATEKESIPDKRELRGRTPIWQNIMYGGKGGR